MEFETGKKADGGADAVHRECLGTGSDGVAGGEVGAGTHHSREPGDRRGPGVSRGEGVGDGQVQVWRGLFRVVLGVWEPAAPGVGLERNRGERRL